MTFFFGPMVGHRTNSPDEEPSFYFPTTKVLVMDTANYVPKPQNEYHERLHQQFYPWVETSRYIFTKNKALADILGDDMLRGWTLQSVVVLANYYELARLNSILLAEHPLVKSVTTIRKFQGYPTDVVILTLGYASVGFFDNFNRQYIHR